MDMNADLIKPVYCWLYKVLLIIGIGAIVLSTFGLMPFFGSPLYLILILGIYLKGSYRFIWGGDSYRTQKLIICACIPVLLMTAFVIEECLNPYMAGPILWMICDTPIDYPSMWLDCWRFWWIGSSFKSAMNLSVVIIYLTLFGKWMINRMKDRI